MWGVQNAMKKQDSGANNFPGIYNLRIEKKIHIFLNIKNDKRKKKKENK